MAEFETGFFSSPSDLKTAADALDAEIANIDNAIDGNDSIPQDLWDGFTAFQSQWKTFYHANFQSMASVWGSWLTSDLQAQLVSFQGQAQTWGQQMQRYGAEIPGGIIEPAKPPTLPGLPVSFNVALVIVLLIVVAWKVLD